MKHKKILILSSEVVPYQPQSEQAINSCQIAKAINEHGGQTRIFMPRYGLINERRHQLHEVIRLSGMNLVINDMDMPLIIKVASIPKERMQVYFIDNEEYFKRRSALHDEKGKIFKDNDERMIFFTKGVIETVKKLNWAPDIIHVHGWMASLLPLYLKEFYKEEPLFTESKIITSLYDNRFEGNLNETMADKIKIDHISEEKITTIQTPNFTNILKSAIENSDAIIHGSETISEELSSFLEEKEIPVLEYQSEDLKESYLNFYADLIAAN